MPNWTTNKISFTGDKEKVKYIVESIQECIEKDVGIMNHFIPRPYIYDKYDTTNHKSENMKIGEKLYVGIDPVIEKPITQELIDRWKEVEQEQMDKYGVIGWYNWNCKYWGTKWDMCDPYIDTIFNYLECQTAWDAPIPFCTTLSRRFPGLIIYMQSAYEEGGYDAWLFKEGNVEVTGITDDFYTYCVNHYEDDEEEAEC